MATTDEKGKEDEEEKVPEADDDSSQYSNLSNLEQWNAARSAAAHIADVLSQLGSEEDDSTEVYVEECLDEISHPELVPHSLSRARKLTAPCQSSSGEIDLDCLARSLRSEYPTFIDESGTDPSGTVGMDDKTDDEIHNQDGQLDSLNQTQLSSDVTDTDVELAEALVACFQENQVEYTAVVESFDRELPTRQAAMLATRNSSGSSKSDRIAFLAEDVASWRESVDAIAELEDRVPDPMGY